MSTFDLLTPRLPLLPRSQGGEDLSDHVSGQRGVSRCGTDIQFAVALSMYYFLERNVTFDQIITWIGIKT